MRAKQFIISFFFITNSIWGIGQDFRFKIEGTVNAFDPDDESMKGLPLGDVKAVLKNTSGNEYVTYTDSNGFYEFEFDSIGNRIVLPEREYIIEVSSISKSANDGNRYFSSKGYESTKGISESIKFIKDFALISLSCPGVDILFPVLYHMNCGSLKSYSEYEPSDSLDYILQILLENPTIIIEIACHSTQFESENQNLKCGEKVGKEIINFLVEKGIHKERLVAVSYGSMHPIISYEEINELNMEKQKEAEQKNNRVTFRVTSYDFEPD